MSIKERNENAAIPVLRHGFEMLKLVFPELKVFDEDSELFQIVLEIEEIYEAQHQLKIPFFKNICPNGVYMQFYHAASDSNPNIHPEFLKSRIAIALLEINSTKTDFDEEAIYDAACYNAFINANGHNGLLNGATVADIEFVVPGVP